MLLTPARQSVSCMQRQAEAPAPYQTSKGQTFSSALFSAAKDHCGTIIGNHSDQGVRMKRIGIVLSLSLAALPVCAQYGAKNGEWRTYGGDLGQTRYSALSQINATNFNNLELAWSFKTTALGPRPEFNLQATPLMAKGI